MDTTIRALERKMVTGDIDAALKLGRIKDGLRRTLEPCIILCPIGVLWCGRIRGKYPRGPYVSILFELGPWQHLPTIGRTYGIRQRLSNDFFLHRLRKTP